MAKELIKLPDVDWVTGMSVDGDLVLIEYRNVASADNYSLPTTVKNAQFLLSLLSDLPDADQIFHNAREFRRLHPIR